MTEIPELREPVLQGKVVMRTIGLIGGMSWRASMQYYQIINQSVNQKLGKEHSAEIILKSLNFQPMINAMEEKNWKEVESRLSEALLSLKFAGAEVVSICTNTMHKPLENIEVQGLEVVHIVDALLNKLQNVKKIGLLGTQPVMKEDFYKRRLMDAGIEVVVPSKEFQEMMQYIIFKKLSVGHVSQDSMKVYKNAIREMEDQGIEGVALSCTELNMVVDKKSTGLPLFDTTVIHAKETAKVALSSGFS